MFLLSTYWLVFKIYIFKIFFQEHYIRVSKGLDLSYSTQLSTKFIVLINVKMPTIVGILTFISTINTTSERLKTRNVFICRYFSVYEQLKFRAQLSWAWKEFFKLGACIQTVCKDIQQTLENKFQYFRNVVCCNVCLHNIWFYVPWPPGWRRQPANTVNPSSSNITAIL